VGGAAIGKEVERRSGKSGMVVGEIEEIDFWLSGSTETGLLISTGVMFMYKRIHEYRY